MAQYAILIYAQDSAHAPDATPQDTEPCDQHSDEATAAYQQALALAANDADRTFLEAQIAGL